MASWVLIGFLNISWSHLHKLTFVHSLVLPPALKFYPPPPPPPPPSTLDYPSYIFSVSFVFLNSLLLCVISTVQWSGATSICDGIIFIWLQYCGERLWRAVGRCWLRSRVSPEIDLPVSVHSREVYSSPDRWQCNHLDLGCKFIQVRKCPFMQVINT